ncbi:MAG: ornithine carbamoyltransferase [Archaeoglobaceae archaeon]
MKHLLSISDLTKDEIFEILYSATQLKSERYRNVVTDYLTNKSMAMVFELPSTRTRVSFEVAMTDLGGHALCLTRDELQLSRGEPVKDTARTLSRYVHAVMIRSKDHVSLEEFAAHSTVPIINGLSDREHPCQVLTDLMTIMEYKNKLDGVNITWIGDGNNVCNSLILASAIVGIKLTISSPPGFEPNKEVLEKAKNMNTDLNFEIDPEAAVEDTDVIYTDVWTSMGKEEEKDKRTDSFSNYQVNEHLLEGAKDGVIVLHCLPAHRGEEITEEVIEGPRSVVFEQAENRLHVQKAIILKLMEQENE